VDFRLNDVLTYNYKLTNYYAYDDATAEYSAGLTQPANQLAYRFDMKTNAKDTINGLYIHYPLFAGSSPTSMKFFILKDEGGVPGAVLHEELIPVSRTTNNEFITINLQQGVPVQGSFFIGYTEPVNGHVRIGLDKSNDTGNRLFYRSSEFIDTWSINDRVTGSLMIRPRFGTAKDVVTGLPETNQLISLYPNPNNGEFYVDNQITVLGIVNITGQSVGFSSEESGDKKRITLATPVSGVYLVKYQHRAGISATKIYIKN
jgi:hypothetical protein